jgi:hypothetical protein
MKHVLILLLLVIPLSALAQRVPLELDQTIQLPTSSGIWDVMPHPDGYYVWVQAYHITDNSTRLFWGRTDSSALDSFDLAVGFPNSVTCFWRDNYVPHVVLESRTMRPPPRSWCDSTIVRIYNLRSGVPDDYFWRWVGDRLDETYPWGGHAYEDNNNYHIIATSLRPTPPQISTDITSLVGYTRERYSSTHDGVQSSRTHPGMCLVDMNHGAAGSVISLLGNFEMANYTISRDSSIFVFAGSWHEYWGVFGINNCGELLATNLVSGHGLTLVDTLANHIHQNGAGCEASRIAVTHFRLSHSLYCFTFFNNVYGAFHSLTVNTPIWTTEGPYREWFAVELVPNNITEEFLCYHGSRSTFDIFDAVSGICYGTTDTISIPVYGNNSRIIGRYDNTSRRLVFQIGNQLKLYRFGAYLAANEQPLAPPSSFSLSAYPNPFNPSTQIAFSLPKELRVKLAVFDLNGREVKTLVDDVIAAGEHRVLMDGSNLPSGVYFARLSGGGVSRTQKLLLLK